MERSFRILDSIVKRDGSAQVFDADKIQQAVLRCFLSMGWGKLEATVPAAIITDAVLSILKASREPVTVEYVQRLVIQQLWAHHYFDAAERYTLYREQRRKTREEEKIDPETVRLIDEDAARFPTALQMFQFLDKYARWREDDKRRETWQECCDRVIGWMRKHEHLAAVDETTWQQLWQGMYEMQASPAMRVVQMAGPALDRCMVGSFNCTAADVDCLEIFPEALYILMQGSGFAFSVESEVIDRLPRIRKQKNKPPQKFVVPDTTEGWCDALRIGLECWFAGEDVEFDYSLIRPEGARLKTKGGRSSGPGPLRQMLEFVRKRVLERQGNRLRPRDAHEIMCMIGKIVAVGGVRRAAELSLSDLDDVEMRDLKSGNWWERSPWLDMSNNSAVFTDKPSSVEFMEEWLALAKSGSGERGIWNRAGVTRNRPRRRKLARFVTNACAEVVLRGSGQMCNLSIAVARYDDTPQSLAEKVRLATIFGTIQSTFTKFNYLRDVWRKNVEEERLLGVDINGQMDCPLLRPGAAGRLELVKSLKELVLKTNEEWAARLGIPVAAAATCIKPSGNSAVLFGCRSGVHVGFAKYQIRRVRVSKNSPMASLLASEGVPHETDAYNPSLLVFDFLPLPLADGTPVRDDLSAIEQFHNWLFWKKNWSEHSVSATIYVKPDEWLDLGNEVYRNFDDISGLSFLPYDNGCYAQAPNHQLSREEYEASRAVFPTIRWHKLARWEKEDTTTSSRELACSGGACELV
jgi:ribonucleoside-diphosphate reductase alpha chain